MVPQKQKSRMATVRPPLHPTEKEVSTIFYKF
jgi:hypothetical protein